MEYAKINDGLLYVTNTDNLPQESIDWLIQDGQKEPIFEGIPQIVGYQGVKERYEELEDKIIVHYDIVEYDKPKVEKRIEELKQQLAQWDYKVSKNNEYRDAGMSFPYNPQEIYARNQPFRDEINGLEEILMNL